MMCNQMSNKIEWGHMNMPEIVIDSDNESATKNYENEPYDNRFLETHHEESNRLSCKLNLDDVDSGIHESNDMFLPGINSELHSNRLSLRDTKRRTNLSEMRSYSTNCLPVDCARFKEGIGITDPRLCRNCSTKTYSKKQLESTKIEFKDIQLLVREVTPKPEIKPKNSGNGDSIQQRLCRIRVLLVCMKILLGSTMTYLGLFLWSISKSIEAKDCAFWASGPLLVSGLYDVFTFNWRKKLKRRMRICYIMTIICGVMSFICSILCLLSSIFSGIHGNWISGHSDVCYREDDDHIKGGIASACCYNSDRLNKIFNSSVDSCICRDSRLNQQMTEIITMRYKGLNCRYVFSAVKDYLILQCALMGVGSGVCLWVLQMTIQRVLHEWSMARHASVSQDRPGDQNCIEQSPVIPMKLRCTPTEEKRQIISNIILEKSSHNQSNNRKPMKDSAK